MLNRSKDIGALGAKAACGILLVLACLLGGCASGTSPQFSVPEGQYAKAFDVTRDLLREYRFVLERVDSEAGVITTAPKFTAGIVTPWDKEQTSLSQEFEDLFNQDERRVRVTFEAQPEGDLANATDVVGRVEVTIYRLETSGVRSPAKTVALTTLTTDPVAVQMGVSGQYEVPLTQDSRLAARLADQIGRRLAQ
jgi:hypothetical protein